MTVSGVDLALTLAAKPGNPGYGFRRARWRDTISNGEDRRMCETVLRGLGVSQERLDRIRQVRD